MNRATDEHLSTSNFIAAGQDQAEREQREQQEQFRPSAAGGAAMEPEAGPLLPPEAGGELRSRWDQIQTGFVDEPRSAVKQADELVALTMKRLAENFSEERNKLERQWDRGDEVSTEDLRVALRKYRTFFNRLLSV